MKKHSIAKQSTTTTKRTAGRPVSKTVTRPIAYYQPTPSDIARAQALAAADVGVNPPPLADYSAAAIRRHLRAGALELFAGIAEIEEATATDPNERHILMDYLVDESKHVDGSDPVEEPDLYSLIAHAAIKSGDLGCMRAAMGALLRWKTAQKIECDAMDAAKAVAS